ncbi:thymidine kinase [Squirrelpox virus]|uniref:Thymidine kinase n=1 Tax=Squirrelpox virus TaxID=240426 RepID=U3UB95_9POXV|nr:thymidine kinase [Squirrelpox virus]CCD83222.1 thymidine kinase [Squirrelpox virus]
MVAISCGGHLYSRTAMSAEESNAAGRHRRLPVTPTVPYVQSVTSFSPSFAPSVIRYVGAQATRGQIQVILGPMFSGKSTELLRRMNVLRSAGQKCVMIKHANDARYGDNVATHDKVLHPAISATMLWETMPDVLNADVVGIDEGQFFIDLVEFCEDMANAGKIVIVAALDGTFQRTLFGSVYQLLPLAESFVKLSSVCVECLYKASFTRRLGNNTEIVQIGDEGYQPVCRLCYFKHQQEQQTQQAQAAQAQAQSPQVVPQVQQQPVIQQVQVVVPQPQARQPVQAQVQMHQHEAQLHQVRAHHVQVQHVQAQVHQAQVQPEQPMASVSSCLYTTQPTGY